MWRLFSINYSKELAKTKREREEKLQRNLQIAKAQFEQNPCEEGEKILDDCNAELDNFYEEKANGLIVRARARWHEYGEKSTKYFLSLEKRNYTRKHIRKLCLSGVITKNYQKILDSSSEYYKKLYRSKLSVSQSDVLDHFLGNANIPTLSEEERLSCEGQITTEECAKALDTFDTGKTPGNDGIPVEFYKTFWNSVGVFMTDVFNYSFELGQMSSSQKQAVISLIDKKGKDRMFLENWRPISLINVDSKIATKVIANRIKNVLPGIIHSNQSGFMKGRFIGETARSVLDIIAHTESSNLPGVLLFIDFEKAFDSIERDFLYKSLERFNFGPSFIKWIQTFYNNLSSCVLNNGFFSSPFQLERGVRQGDPLSPYLFLIAIEIMAISIRTNEQIEGIKIGEDETKSLLYADDMTATLANISSVEKVIQTLHNFENCSGLKMNLSKTKAMWIGKNKNSLETPLGLEWCTGIRTLGIHFSCDQEQVLKQNFHDRLDECQKLINLWKLRGLSLFGKVAIIKSFLIPKLLYVSSIIETPPEIVKQMEKMIFIFLWKGPDKVTRLSVINTLDNGGLNLTDFESHIKALRLSWIPRLLDEREGPWKSYLKYKLKTYGGCFLFRCNYDVKDLDLSVSNFYLELLLWWAEFRRSFSDVNYSQNVIWNNKDIRINNKPVFYKRFFDKGIIYLNDLQFNVDNVRSYEFFKQKGLDTNFLTWTALRSSVKNMKSKSSCNLLTVGNLDPMNFEYNATKAFNAYTVKCNQFYSMMISTKAKTPNSFKKLLADFNFSNPQDAFSIPYQSASETYVWSFQYRLLNFILFTNDKLFKIGLSDSDKCSFCGTYTEDLYHLFFNCSSVRVFWNRFAVWWSDISGENLSLSLKDIIIGFLHRKDLLNYLIILGKITIWECRKNKIPPKLRLFLHKVEAKQEVEKIIAIKNRKLRDFYTRWELLL